LIEFDNSLSRGCPFH